MKSLIIFFFALFSTQCFSQNDQYKIYKNAINIIKKSSEFSAYVQDNNLNNNIKFPQPKLSALFKDFDCCDCETTKKEVLKRADFDLQKFSTFSNESSNDAVLYFSSIEKSYLLAKITSQKKKTEDIVYIFKVENDNVILLGTNLETEK